MACERWPVRPPRDPCYLFARGIIRGAKLEENMADRLNIQDAVLGVVENLHSLNRHQLAPPGPSNLTLWATVTGKQNRSIQIPRRSQPRDSSTMNENERWIHMAQDVSVPPSFQNLATGFSNSQNYSTVRAFPLSALRLTSTLSSRKQCLSKWDRKRLVQRRISCCDGS